MFSALSIASVFAIPKAIIDDAEARGLPDGAGDAARPRGWASLFESKALLVAAAALMLFYLGDAAMLPLYGMAVVAAHRGDPAGFVAMTIVVAQGVMVRDLAGGDEARRAARLLAGAADRLRPAAAARADRRRA